MQVQPSYYLHFDPANPNYEENIRQLASKYPDHPKVQQYRRLVADGKVELPDGTDQSDAAWAKEMVALAEDDESNTKDLTDDELILDFCNGTGAFAEST